MTRIFTEGFESAVTSGFENVGTLTALTDTPRTGAYCARPGATTCYKTVSDLSEGYIRFGLNLIDWRTNGDQRWASLYTDTTLHMFFSFESNTSGIISLYNGSTVRQALGIHELAKSTWHLIEVYFKIHDTEGRYVIKANGITEIDFTGDTRNGTPSTINRIGFYSNTANNLNLIDDIAINDTAGSVDNSWCGDGHVIALTPDGVGDASELTPSSGSVNYLMVDATPYNETDYVESNTPDAKDLYNLASSGLVSGSHIINRVFVEVIAKDTTTGSGTIATAIQSGSSLVEEASQGLSTVYSTYMGTDNYLNPATGLAWTVDELDALQVGVVVKA